MAAQADPTIPTRGIDGMQLLAQPRSIVIMGVSGSGKSTIGKLLAENLKARFTDGDRLHSDNNISLMASGHALKDSDRLPWLRTVGKHLASFESRDDAIVVACSALKRSYRNVLREYVAGIYFVFLDGPPELVKRRLTSRYHEFMPPSLLASQLESLEPLGDDEHGIRVDIRLSPADIVQKVVTGLTESTGSV